MYLRILVAVSLLASMALAAAGLPVQEKRERVEEVRRLIEQLNSPRYRERDEAARKLLDMEREVLPALQKALDSPTSLDFRRRVENILGVFHERQRQRDRVAAIARGKRVAVDLLVERLAVRGKAASPDDWQAVGEIARAMTLWAGDKTGQPDRWFVPLQGDYLKYPLWVLETWKDDGRKSLDKRIIVGADSNVSMANWSVIICRRNLGVYITASNVVLLLNGDLKMTAPVGTSIQESVIFCDGDVNMERIRRSVIVATGKITFTKHFFKENVIIEKARNPLPFLKLFEPADVGIEVAATDGHVQLKEVRPGSAFARAGAQPGDRVVAVGGTAVASAEQFRRLLRSSVAANAKTAFHLRRGHKELQLRVSFRE